MTAQESLFIGCFPTGLGYADRRRERHGDYQHVARVSFATLQLELEKDCPADLVPLVKAHHASMEARRGEEYQVSMCGQSVILGSASLVGQQIVIAWTEPVQKIVKQGRIDLGELHTFETVQEPRACMWCLNSTLDDYVRAKIYAKKEGYHVLVYPRSEAEPLKRARADVSAKAKI